MLGSSHGILLSLGSVLVVYFSTVKLTLRKGCPDPPRACVVRRSNGKSATLDNAIVTCIIWLGNNCHIRGGGRNTRSKCTILPHGRLLTSIVEIFARFKCLLRVQIGAYTTLVYEGIINFDF